MKQPEYLLLIPTRGRVKQKSFTLDHIPRELIQNTIVICPEDEVEHWCRKYDVAAVACPVVGINHVRQWATETFQHEAEVILMLDDDLHFAVRENPEDMTNWKLVRTLGPDPAAMALVGFNLLRVIEMCSEEHPMVGICARSGNNRITERVEWNRRVFSAYAFHPRTLLDRGIRWDKLKVMEDFYVVLSLLTSGYNIPTVCDFVHDQVESNAPGGCSLIRTAAVQAASALALQAMFPDFVKTVDKKTDSGWFEGGVRKDVIVQWKKAAKQGKLNSSLL